LAGPVVDLLDILAPEVNARRSKCGLGPRSRSDLKGKADFPELGKRYGKDTPRAGRGGCRSSGAELQALERGDPVRSGDFEFRPGRRAGDAARCERLALQADGPYVAAVDPR